MLMSKSGAGAAATATLVVIGAAALLPVAVSPGVAVVPLNTGCVPTVLTFGVTGT